MHSEYTRGDKGASEQADGAREGAGSVRGTRTWRSPTQSGSDGIKECTQLLNSISTCCVARKKMTFSYRE
jgi:hypothetical protein